MKKRYIFLIIILVGIIMFEINYSMSINESKNNTNNYWNELNSPIFYGASKITIPLNYSFDTLDSRFRVFAKDFEDGDLNTNIIITDNNVDTSVVGNYQVIYHVSDSNSNEVEFIQEVIVKDNINKINVERILYTIPSVSNMDLAGLNRANYADRQILGLYLPASSSFKARVIDGDLNVTIGYFTNDSSKEGSTTTLNSEWQDIVNNKNYSSIPLVNTNVLSKDNTEINKTLKIELEFALDSKKLNYYYYKDDEQAFMDNWIDNEYAIVDSERIMVVVPLPDKNYIYGYYTFESLDKFFEYYNKVLETYDEIVGLEYNPTYLSDQNVRTKYLVKANASGSSSAAAYYGLNHVAVVGSSVKSFFERNWGGLHELAHGYQGSLGGNDDMSLGEVSNNILGHYVQIDKTIFDDNQDWLGKLINIEEYHNNARLNSNSYSNLELKTRLYLIINLFDYFEGKETYAKMFKWYRMQLTTGRKMKNQDAYVESIADIYKVNIIPYMESWGLKISDSVKSNIYERNLPLLNILKDTISNDNDLSNYMLNNNVDLKYTLVDNTKLNTTNLKGNITINIDIDDINVLKGKKIFIKDQNNIIKEQIINESSITIKDINLGTYMLSMPIIDNYESDYQYILVNQNNSNITYKYTKLDNIEYNNYLHIKVYGVYNTSGIELLFKDNYKKVNVLLGKANMGGSDSYVKIFDNNGQIVLEENVDGIYFNFNKEGNPFDIDIDTGYIIEIKRTNYLDRVKIISTLSNSEVSDLLTNSDINRYVVLDNGIKLENMSDEEASNISYNNLRNTLINIIEDYKISVSDEELNNKNINFKVKANVISAFNKLSNADKILYQEFIDKVRQGGKPSITYIGEDSYKIGSDINLYSLISVIDNEDNNIIINDETTSIDTNFNPNSVGTYKIIYKVKDSDYNVVSFETYITIIDEIYTINQEDKLTFKINADYELFNNNGKVYIDDKLISKNDYTSLSGSIIIKLKDSFYNKLDRGIHTLKVMLNNNKVLETTFNKEETIIINEVPKTFDSIYIYVIILALSLLGLIIIKFIKK